MGRVFLKVVNLNVDLNVDVDVNPFRYFYRQNSYNLRPRLRLRLRLALRPLVKLGPDCREHPLAKKEMVIYLHFSSIFSLHFPFHFHFPEV